MITLPRKDLLTALSSVIHAKGRAVLPVSENARFQVTGNLLSITCANPTLSISYDITLADYHENTETTAPVSLLRDICSDLKNDELTIGWDKNRFTIYGSTNYRIPVIAATEFFDVATPDLDAMQEMDSQALVNGLVAAIHASADDKYPERHGACINGSGIYATDGKRAVKFPTNMELDCVIPVYVAQTIAKLFSHDKLVRIAQVGRMLYVSNGTVTLAGQVSAASKYPNVGALISQLPEPTAIAICDTHQLQRMVKRVSMVLGDANRAMRLDINSNAVHCTASSPEYGDSTEHCVATTEKAGHIFVSCDFLNPALAACTSPTTKIELRGPHSPLVLRSESHVELIMPIRQS
jgi:DNA polymerase III sliding clamp (beta) subunit (PCNA family)